MPVTLRSQALQSKYHLFLDITGHGKRKKQYLKIYMSRDYTSNMKFTANGKPKIKFANDMDKINFETAWNYRGQKEHELNIQQTDFFNHANEKKSFLQYFSIKLIIKNNSTYNATFDKLNNYTNGVLRFKDVDLEFLNRFKNHLLADDDLSTNSVNTYLNRLKIIWKEAIREGKTEKNPFLQFTLPKKVQTEKSYLNIGEVKKMAKIKMDTERAEVIRKAFLFCCFTGLRYSDVTNLDWENVQDDFLVFRQVKSKTNVLRIPVHKTAINILNSMDKNTVKVFPSFSNTEANLIIKKIAFFAEIDKHVTFHTSRHSCATILFESGVNIHMISKMLGHSGIDMTKIYTHLADTKMQEAVNSIEEIDIIL
jgi:site-specific recombinase XerD